MRISTFLKKSVNLAGKQSSSSFLREHRTWLSTFPKVLPLLVALEEGKLLPTPVLQQVCTLLSLEKDPTIAIESVDKETGEVSSIIPKKAAEKAAAKAPRRYTVFIFTAEEVVDTDYADLYQEAQRMAERKLFHRGDAIYAVIYGDGLETRVSREDAMRELLKRGPGGVQATRKVGGMSTAPCATVKNFVAKFSGC